MASLNDMSYQAPQLYIDSHGQHYFTKRNPFNYSAPGLGPTTIPRKEDYRGASWEPEPHHNGCDPLRGLSCQHITHMKILLCSFEALWTL